MEYTEKFAPADKALTHDDDPISSHSVKKSAKTSCRGSETAKTKAKQIQEY